ncbi:MAG: hypothetical protein IKB82_07415 [Clostridia bacterium]|nr:hypothetical protein [Clostridia bacterium]
MDMKDIAKLAQEVLEKITSDEKLMAAFKKDPVALVEKKLGIDLPNDQINALVDAIKAKINVDEAMDMAGKLLGMLGKK